MGGWMRLCLQFRVSGHPKLQTNRSRWRGEAGRGGGQGRSRVLATASLDSGPLRCSVKAFRLVAGKESFREGGLACER